LLYLCLAVSISLLFSHGLALGILLMPMIESTHASDAQDRSVVSHLK
jgi:hypothetical protein